MGVDIVWDCGETSAGVGSLSGGKQGLARVEAGLESCFKAGMVCVDCGELPMVSECTKVLHFIFLRPKRAAFGPASLTELEAEVRMPKKQPLFGCDLRQKLRSYATSTFYFFYFAAIGSRGTVLQARHWHCVLFRASRQMCKVQNPKSKGKNLQRPKTTSTGENLFFF